MPPKPQTKWSTDLHEAFRLDGQEPAHGGGSRAECFELRFHDGHRGRAEFSLAQQRVDEQSLAKDPELAFAARAWLIARGQRKLDLRTLGGEALQGGELSLHEFDALEGEFAKGTVASLAPSNYDLLQALGAENRLVACEDSTPLPEAAKVARLGPDLDPDLDALRPKGVQLALASLSVPGMERVVMGLRQRKIPHVVFAPRSLDEIDADLGRVAQALGVDASKVQARFREKRESLAAAAAELVRPVRVFLEWWPRPQFSPGADCYSNELIALAGGVNVFRDCPGSSLEVQAQEVARREPELAFVSWCGVAVDKLDPQKMASHPELAPLDFCRFSRVYPLDEAYSGRPGPKVLVAVEQMAEKIRAYARSCGLL